MKYFTRILFFVSLVVFIIYFFDAVVEYNKVFLYIIMFGFTGSFITSFFGERSIMNSSIRWISAAFVICYFAYVFIFSFLWASANRP